MYNILYISHISSINGAPKSMLGILERLNKEKFHPYVLLPGHGPLEDELKLLHIDYYIIDYKQNVRKDATESFSLSECWDFYRGEMEAVCNLCKLINSLNIDIIHTNCSTVDIGAFAAIITKKPHVWHVREFVEDDFGWKFINPVMQKILMKSSFVLSISKAIREIVRVRYSVKTRTMYDGIDRKEYYKAIDDNKKTNAVTKLIIAGSILKEKGQKEAIEAVALLLEEGYKVSLSIVGSGNKDYICELNSIVKEKGIENNIQFIPFTRNPQEVWSGQDITLVCSKCEALGRVTIESMLAGIPIVGSNTGGTVELVGQNEERGYLYEKGNVLNLKEKIKHVILNADEVKKKIVRAQEFALNKFDIVNYMQSIEFLYIQILERHYNETTI
ncbi:glycosyltransferase [Parablautia intestinalis]|uniref:Glycosyltransferase n=1 Tax=Parablautia intestinalis TaxID=2320100 RepID=A0A3A9AC20_9FIRM|nr:glycosyltransferase [Parablautia intestinalis]RKI88664.1 glycosyltransferase [Parablautia intestinalis]